MQLSFFALLCYNRGIKRAGPADLLNSTIKEDSDMKSWLTHNKSKLLLLAVVSVSAVVVLSTAAVMQACRLVEEHFDY